VAWRSDNTVYWGRHAFAAYLDGQAVERDITFGRLLHRLRKARDLTQAALAQQAYCSLDTIKKIEIGARRPSQPMAEQFADCLALAGDARAAFLATARASSIDANAAANAATVLRRIKLPYQPTPFVGRRADLSALDALFADSTTRLVTIIGPGGIGKTRLAIALAEQLIAAGRFPEQVCFVPLASLDAAEQIVPALAEALNFPLDAGKQPARSARQQVFDYLRPKRILLVFDNVEHLLGDSGDAADLIANLLADTPDVAILATSRERLKLRDEHVYVLGGLDLPSAEARLGDNAVALFAQCARRLRPDFAPTRDQLDVLARICHLVDGMPLAIELAAGWVDTLSLSDIVAEIERGLDVLATELRNLPARHRSMRAVFDSSYQRLHPAEQAVFVRLAIFRGGGTLAAVQATTQATPPQLHVLIGASLLYYDAGRCRYTLHELLRQYALEQLGSARDEEQSARDQHATYYCAFVHRHGVALAGFDQQAALAAIESERENVRAAWMWAAQRGRVDLLALAADGLGYFYEWCAAFDDSERMYGSAAQLEFLPADDQATRVLAMLRAWQGNFRRLQGDITGAEQVLQHSLALLESSRALLDTRAERAFMLLQLGLVASEGALGHARQFFETSLALYQALDRRWEASHVLLWLGDLARDQGCLRRCAPPLSRQPGYSIRLRRPARGSRGADLGQPRSGR
jgi:predicted ATPase/DNA-binding XRE family transcriptional regulator